VFDFSRFLLDVESRVRRVRGLALLAPILCVSGLAALAYATLAVAVFSSRPSAPEMGLIAGVPCLAALVGYLAGRARPVDLPRALLQIDDAVESQAAFSSLYELRRRGACPVFGRRIEASLHGTPRRWKRGVPIGPAIPASAAFGLVCLLGALAVFALPIADAPPPVEAAPEQDAALRTTASPERSVASPTPSVVEPSDRPSADPIDPPGGAPTPSDRDLRDALADLRTAPSDAILGAPPSDELARRADEQRQTDRLLSDLLQRIKQRLDAAGLSDGDRESLREHLSRPLSPQARAALHELLQTDDPDRARELIDRLTGLLQGEESSAERPESEDSPGAPPDAGTVSEGLDPFPPLETWPDSDNTDAPDAAGPSDTPPPSAFDEGADRADGKVDESGGQQTGRGSLETEEERPRAGFVEEQAPATIGPSGEFTDFLTRGVPIETATRDAGGALPVSYERMESILRTRGIPTADWHVVRDYFDAITKGGP